MYPRAFFLVHLALVGWAGSARAEPLRLRGDALAQTRSPVGLLVLQGNDKIRPWIDAETVSWLGVTDNPSPTGDVLTLSVRVRHAGSGSELRVGRMIVSGGAIRPMHLDGARGVLRSPWGTSAEAFSGSLVTRGFDQTPFSWAAGGRLSQAVTDRFVVGSSFVQARTAGELSRSEAGADLAFTPASWFTTAARSAVDLVSRRVADALVSTSVQSASSRLELFATHRSAGSLLPATSLFSVLGDYAATTVGTTVRRRLFPRLDVVATGSSQRQDTVFGGQGLIRTMLALDDDWAGVAGIEVRRVHFGESRWSGVRGTLALPLSTRFRAGTELELVVPDHPQGRGAVWPWALLSLGYRLPSGWDMAMGVEASSGRTYVAEVHGLARLSYTFDAFVEPRQRARRAVR